MPSASEPSRDLRVALPMLTLVPGGMGGSETYARELGRELAVVAGLKVTAMVSRAGCGVAEGPDERVVPQFAGGGSTLDRMRTLAQGRRHRSALHHLLADADVVHYPFSVPVPRPPRRTPCVVTLHDVQHRDMPHLFSRVERLYRTVFYDRAAQRADRVVTISQFSKDRAVAHLGLDPERVHVAHLGVNTSDFRANLGPREQFVLYPARGWAHKNHRRLVEAMGLVRRDHPDLHLVLTGGGLESIGETPTWVHKRGLVSQGELLDLNRRASCLAFPSLYEGFGLPPLEAMASGCPVAAAAAGSLPEVCGDAAVLFDPEDPRAIAHGIRETLAHGPQLTGRGLDRVKQFTWKACANAHVRVYRELAANEPKGVRTREGSRGTGSSSAGAQPDT